MFTKRSLFWQFHDDQLWWRHFHCHDLLRGRSFTIVKRLCRFPGGALSTPLLSYFCYFLLFFKLFTPQFPWDVYLQKWSLISCLFNSILIGDLTFISSVSCLGIISKDQNICSREACSLIYFKKTVSKRLYTWSFKVYSLSLKHHLTHTIFFPS